MKVLICDDDPVLRLLMRTLLQKRMGYEVFETTDGLKAWEVLDAGLVADLCIVDTWMPGLTGVELISKLRSDPRFGGQKVILCSLENSRSAIMKAVSLGISGYILKPFVAQKFVDEVRRVCEGKQAAPVSQALEAIEAVIERLGGDRNVYLEMLNVFAKDVEELIRELRHSGVKYGELKTHLARIRGAGRSLGSEALVAVITRMEAIDAAAEPSSIQSCADSLHIENERVIAATALIASQAKPSESKPQEGHSEIPSAASPLPA